MLNQQHKLAIFMQDALGKREGKMGYGILRYSPNPVVCVIDSTHAGKNVNDLMNLPCSCPVVADVRAAAELGAEVMILGIAPSGGRIPEDWMPSIRTALASGMSIVNGLHDLLAGRFGNDLQPGQWIWDVRRPAGEAPPIAGGRARELANRRVLLVGTDMAIGKMTAGLEIYKWLIQNKTKTAFLATGQIGITITGSGIPLDAYKVDHACGAVERMVMQAADYDVVIVEGQGSLVHPGSTATLPLLRGTCPTHMILCHKAGQTHLGKIPWVRIPAIKDLIRLYEDLSSCCGSLPRATIIGIALNTSHMPEPEARTAIAELEAETDLPVEDPVRFGAGKLAEPLS